MTLIDQDDILGGDSVVVKAETAGGIGQGGIGAGGQPGGSVAKLAEVVEGDKRTTGEGQLVTQDAVKLEGVTDGLMRLQIHDVGKEDDRAVFLGAFVSGADLVHFPDDTLRVLVEERLVEGLPAAGVTPPGGAK